MVLAVLTQSSNARTPTLVHFIQHRSIMLNGTLLQGLVYNESGAGWRFSGCSVCKNITCSGTEPFHFPLLLPIIKADFKWNLWSGNTKEKDGVKKKKKDKSNPIGQIQLYVTL